MIICLSNLEARTGVYGLTAFDNLNLGKMSDPMNEGFIKQGEGQMIQLEGIGEVQRRLKSPVERLGEFDWQQIGRGLDHQGNAVMQRLLSPEQCRSIAGLYSNDDLFRSH